MKMDSVPKKIRMGRLKRGFTLVEIVVTVAILSFGIVTIYEALFVSMDAYGYYTHYLSTQDWMNEKLWESQSTLIESSILEEEQTSGHFIREHKKYNWTQIVSAVDPSQGLYKVTLKLSWSEGNKQSRIEREAYLLPFARKPYNEEGSV